MSSLTGVVSGVVTITTRHFFGSCNIERTSMAWERSGPPEIVSAMAAGACKNEMA